MTAAGFFRITRPANAFMAGLAAVVAYLVATGTLVVGVLLLLVIVSFITAAGNVINDYFDADIDAVNCPERPIPSGRITRQAALLYAALLFLAGIALSLCTTPICIGFAVFNSLLLVLYAVRLKGMPLVGNIAVAYLSGSMFLFGGAFAGYAGLVHLVPLAAITFLATMARELLKDAEDVDGDASGGASTLPIQIGVRKTAYCAFAFAALSAAASIIPFRWWGAPYLVMIGIVDLIILVAAYRALSCNIPACIRKSGAPGLLKYGMFASLIVFTVSAVFLT